MGFRTDLAIEAHLASRPCSGVETRERKSGSVRVTEVRITNDEGARALGRGRGRYITLDSEAISSGDMREQRQLSLVIAQELAALAGHGASSRTLVVGLGNRQVTADSLGPATVDSIFVTRHIRSVAPEQIDARVRDVCAIAPGVLGLTGLETFEIIAGIAERVRPTLIVVIDSLCARDTRRIRTSFQLSDAGIAPGSGLGSKHRALDRRTLGVPVVAVGVPLVVYADTIAQELLSQVIPPDSPEYDRLMRTVSDRSGSELVVTPKDIDFAVEACSRVIADALNVGLHDGITLDEVRAYMA